MSWMSKSIDSVTSKAMDLSDYGYSAMKDLDYLIYESYYVDCDVYPGDRLIALREARACYKYGSNRQ